VNKVENMTTFAEDLKILMDKHGIKSITAVNSEEFFIGYDEVGKFVITHGAFKGDN
jgi:hypothetical protein